MEQSDRAYVHISAGTTRIGNAWIERSWSAFLGHTVGLTDRTHARDWLDASVDDFLLVSGERRMTPMDLGEKEWSEAMFLQGAALTVRHAGLGVVFDICTRVFHRAPFIIRSCRILNATNQGMSLDEVVIDRMQLSARAPEYDVFPMENGGYAGYLLDGGRGMVFAALPEAELAFDSSESATVARCVARSVKIAAGAHCELPDMGVVFFSGARADATVAAETITDQIRKWRTHEAELRASARAEARSSASCVRHFRI